MEIRSLYAGLWFRNLFASKPDVTRITKEERYMMKVMNATNVLSTPSLKKMVRKALMKVRLITYIIC
ncbi:hypothetical protein AgCh_027029 [Apium graveolens]